METLHSKILMSLLEAMIGCITPNVRAITVDYSVDHIFLYFFYQSAHSEMENNLANEISSRIAANFPEIAKKSFQFKQIVYPYPDKIKEGFPVYHRYEPTPKGAD